MKTYDEFKKMLDHLNETREEYANKADPGAKYLVDVGKCIELRFERLLEIEKELKVLDERRLIHDARLARKRKRHAHKSKRARPVVIPTTPRRKIDLEAFDE